MRRRNVKNAHERLLASSGVIILNPTEYKGKWHSLFNNQNPIYLEIGMGKGDFIKSLAINNPNINYLGFEKYESVIVQAVEKIKDLNLHNLKLICADATNVLDIFEKEEISKIYLNFSDPWPKARHEKRRLTSPNFLSKYVEICQKPCQIEFKTDNQGLFEYSIMSLNNQNWQFLELSFDLHKAKENVVMTEYEKKFHALGHPIYYVNSIYKE